MRTPNLGLISINFILISTSAFSMEICSGTTAYDLNNIINKSITCNGIPYKPLNMSKINEIDHKINLALNSAGISYKSFEITKEIIDGKSAIDVGKSFAGIPANGIMLSIPGVFEIKLKSVNGKMMWSVEGALADELMRQFIKYIPGVGFIEKL